MMNFNNELYHYGVPGMRWGVRKSYKSAGQNDSDDAKEARKIKTKKVNEMTNDELQKLNKRQQLEKTHRELNPSKIAKGIAIAGAIALAIGTINNLYNNSKNAIKNGQEVTQKYKSHQLSAKRKKQTQEIGKGLVNKHSDSKISGIPHKLYTNKTSKKR